MPARTCWFMSVALTPPFLPSKRSTAGCTDTDLPAGRRYFGQSDKPLIGTAHVYHAMWVMFTETRCKNESASTSKGSGPSSFSRTNSWVFDEIHLAEHPLTVEGRW